MTSIVVDTSAVMAIVRADSGADRLSQRMQSSDRRLMSTGSGLELGLVLESRTTTLTTLDALRSLQIELTPFDEPQFELGLRAWRQFGKGSHPAGLNLGDCFTYALAKVTGHPILCGGNDFTQTDLTVLTPPLTSVDERPDESMDEMGRKSGQRLEVSSVELSRGRARQQRPGTG